MEVVIPPPPTIEEAIVDLHSRFLNLPVGEMPTVERIFFQIQQAHWFYVDNWADPECWDEETSDTGGDTTDAGAAVSPRRAAAGALRMRNARSVLPYLRFDAFSRRMFAASPMLRDFCDEHAKFKAAFKSYCSTIPRYGVILVNAACDHVLLVQSHGGRSYGWPRGKLNQDELPIDCAAREAMEETGFNPRPLLKEDDFLEVRDKDGGMQRLYIAVGVPDDGSCAFAPQMSKEIDDIAWVQLASIEPAGRSGTALVNGGATKRVKLWLTGFIVKLNAWIAQRARGGGTSSKAARRAARAANHALVANAGAGGGAEKNSSRRTAPVPVPPQVVADRGGERAASVAAATMTTQTTAAVGGATVAAPLAAQGGWSVEDMFASNERILGRAFTYDGNPHTFGDYDEDLTASSGVRPVKIIVSSDAGSGSDSARRPRASAPTDSAQGVLPPPMEHSVGRREQRPPKSRAADVSRQAVATTQFTFDRGPILKALAGSA